MPQSLILKMGIPPKRDSRMWYKSPSYLLNNIAPTLIHDYATGRFYNAIDGTTSFPFSSTRTTNAMQFDALGRLVWAPANLLTRSDPNTATVGSPGTAPTGWGMVLGLSNGVTRSIVAQGTFQGIPYIDLQVTGTFGTVENITVTPAPGVTAITTTAGEGWTGSVFWQIVSGTLADTFTPLLGGVRIRYGNPGLLAQIGSRNTAIYSWLRDSNSSVAPATATVVGTDWVWSFNAGQVVNFTVRIGGMQLERTGPDSPKAYNVTTGAAFFRPRFDFNPLTGEPLGLLVEEARTNDVPKGFRLVAADMTLQNTTASTSPSTYLGGWSAARVTGDGVSAAHLGAAGSVTPGASTVRTVQAIIRPITGTLFQLTGSANWMIDLNGYANFNCTGTGTVTAIGTSASNAFIRPLRDGCYHIGFTVTTIANPTAGAAVIVGLITLGTDPRLPANTSTNSFDFIYSCNALGTGWNSIIPTFGTAVTKAADNVAIATGSWLDQTRGSWFIEIVVPTINDSNRRFLSLSDGTANNKIDLLRSIPYSGQVATTSAGVTNFNPATANTITTFTKSKLVATFLSPSKKVCLNGGTVASSSTAFPTSGYTNLRVGSLVPGGAYAESWIGSIRYYADTSATDLQLQAMTT